MSEVWNPHDRLFKEIWSDREAAADFLGRYFPEGVRRLVELDTLEICKDSFVTGELREYFSDLLYRVSMNDREDGWFTTETQRTRRKNNKKLCDLCVSVVRIGL